MNQNALLEKIQATWPDLLAIYAFGSRITHTERADSDLDLAVLVAGYAQPMELFSLAAQLADIAECSIDLLDLRAASTVMQYQVITTGQRWWALQPQAGLFDCFVLSEKTALDEARAGLLADIYKEGVIHGR